MIIDLLLAGDWDAVELEQALLELGVWS